jgi:hypothetical protein
MSSTGRGGDRITDDVYPTPGWVVDRLLDGFPDLPGGLWIEPCVGAGAIVQAVLRTRMDVRVAGYDLRDTRRDAMTSGCVSFAQQDFALTLQQAQGARFRPRPGEGRPASVVITNPPFANAFEIAKYSVMTGAWTVLLLRLNFLGSGTSNGKTEWLQEHPPDVGVLPNRPSFAASIKCSGEVSGANPRSGGGAVAPASRGGKAPVKGCGWRVMQELEAPRPKVCPACGRPGLTTSTTDSIEYGWFVWPPEDGCALRSAGRLIMLDATPEEERRVTPRTT